jgi:hypothetical protein
MSELLWDTFVLIAVIVLLPALCVVLVVRLFGTRGSVGGQRQTHKGSYGDLDLHKQPPHREEPKADSRRAS